MTFWWDLSRGFLGWQWGIFSFNGVSLLLLTENGVVDDIVIELKSWVTDDFLGKGPAKRIEHG